VKKIIFEIIYKVKPLMPAAGWEKEVPPIKNLSDFLPKGTEIHLLLFYFVALDRFEEYYFLSLWFSSVHWSGHNLQFPYIYDMRK